jgi:membrane associated rhomboid family serine protease
MDWSLVLASQGVEATLEPPGEEHGWALVIAFRDSERALKSLRQYRIENRNWPWQQALPGRRLHFDWVSVAWAGLMILFFAWSNSAPAVKAAGIMDSVKVASGQWWRVFTAMSLHADIGHLAENLSVGILLLGLAMGRFGTGTGLLAAYLAGACGNLLSLAMNARPFNGLGASGMIMGALGLLAAQSLAFSREHRPPLKHLLGGVAAGVMLFILFGLSPGTDIAAHTGGFIAGLLFGGFLVLLPSKLLESWVLNVLCGVLFLAFTFLTWGLALPK